MFKQYREYREMQQLRKDHLAKQRRRQLFIFLGIMGALLLVMMAIEAATPTESPKPAKAVSAVSTPESEELSKSEQIQYDAEWSSKQAKYCLNQGQAAGLQEPELSAQYELCIDETAGWPMEKFE